MQAPSVAPRTAAPARTIGEQSFVTKRIKRRVAHTRTGAVYTGGKNCPHTRSNEPALIEFIREIPNLPIYRYGLVLFAVLLIVPAIVSGNMVQHLATKIVRREISISDGFKALAGNLLVFITSVGVICYAIYVYAGW